MKFSGKNAKKVMSEVFKDATFEEGVDDQGKAVIKYTMEYSCNGLILRRIVTIMDSNSSVEVEDIPIRYEEGMPSIRILVEECSEIYKFENYCSFVWQGKGHGYSIILKQKDGIEYNGGDVFAEYPKEPEFFTLEEMTRMSKAIGCEKSRRYFKDPYGMKTFEFDCKDDMFGVIYNKTLRLEEVAHNLTFEAKLDMPNTDFSSLKIYLTPITEYEAHADRGFFRCESEHLIGEMWIYNVGMPRYRVKFRKKEK